MFNWMMERYKKWIIFFFLVSILMILLIYFLMLPDTPLSAGANLTKSNWLSFIGEYLSFVGTVAVAFISLAQSSYHSEMENRRRAEERHKAIQPLFSVEIVNKDNQVPGNTDLIYMSEPAKNQFHKNIVLDIQIANNNPAKNVIVFEEYFLGSIIKKGDKKSICVAYYDSPDVNCENVFRLTDDHERDEDGIPTWLNIYYEDIDGRSMIQSFILNSDMKTKFYQLEEEPWEA